MKTSVMYRTAIDMFAGYDYRERNITMALMDTMRYFAIILDRDSECESMHTKFNVRNKIIANASFALRARNSSCFKCVLHAACFCMLHAFIYGMFLLALCFSYLVLLYAICFCMLCAFACYVLWHPL